MNDQDDFGSPISYIVLAPGTLVFDSEGAAVGKVEKVLDVPEKDVFDGIVVHVDGLGSRFVDADYVGRLYERRAELSIDAKELAGQPEHENAAPDYQADFAKRHKLRWRPKR